LNPMEKSLTELRQMDELQQRSSPIHARSALSKLLATALYLVTVVSFPKYDLTGLLPMALWPALLFSLSGISVLTCFRKLRLVLPLVLAVGVFNPIFDRQILLSLGPVRISGGTVSMLSLMLKGVLCLCASFLLMATTSIDALCAALRRLHMPSMLVTLLLLTYRYVGVMTEELAIMTNAYHLRAPGQKGIHHSAWGSFLGQLLLRGMDRAGELYSSMQLRGFHGEFYYAAVSRSGPKDWAFFLLSAAFAVLIRCLPVARLLGSLLTR